jgi:hypothetical protein
VNVPQPIEILVIVAAALGAVWTIWKKGVQPTVGFFRAVERIAEATPTLVTIAEEFNPNGGGSLRDAVDRIETKVDQAAAKVEEAAEMTFAHRATLDQMAMRLEGHLSLPAWNQEREEVLARLGALVERQAFMISAIIDVLRMTDSPLAHQVLDVLHRTIDEANPQLGS